MYTVNEECLRKAYVEVLEVLKLISKDEREKIPARVIEDMESNKNKFYKFKLKRLEDISKEAGIILVDLYMTYVATPKNKKIMSEILELNERKKMCEY